MKTEKYILVCPECLRKIRVRHLDFESVKCPGCGIFVENILGDFIDEIIDTLPEYFNIQNSICREIIDFAEYVKIPLSGGNTDISLWAYKCTKQFVEKFNKKMGGEYSHTFYINDPKFDCSEWIYININY